MAAESTRQLNASLFAHSDVRAPFKPGRYHIERNSLAFRLSQHQHRVAELIR